MTAALVAGLAFAVFIDRDTLRQLSREALPLALMIWGIAAVVLVALLWNVGHSPPQYQ